jgi:hypothetical protein
MPDLNEALSQFLARRQQIVAQTLDKGGEQAETLLKSYGAPSQLDAGISGFQQGALHGFADDMERAERGDGVAAKHITSKAARPVEYEVAALLGAMASVGGLRGAQALVGRAASAGARAGARVSGAAGGAAAAAKHGDAAKRIAQKVATFGMKPNHRGTMMDAGHGALMGYGGTDVQADEEAFSAERFLRAGMGAAASTIAAPVATSLGVAAANAPLAFGGRRAMSQKMLEPPGVVTKGQAFWNKVLNRNGPKAANPTGRPRDSIEIARSKDETAARGPVDIFTGRAQNPGIIARDTAPPMQSTQRNVQQLADQAIAPVAPARIADLKSRERNMAGDAIEAQYPRHGQRDATAKERIVKTDDGKEYVVEFDTLPGRTEVTFKPAGDTRADPYLSTRNGTGRDAFQALKAVKGALDTDIAEGGRPTYTIAGNTSQKASIYKSLIEKNKPSGYDVEVVPRHDGKDVVRLIRDDNYTDPFVSQMMEAFVRQDRPALDSWVSTLQAAAKKSPNVMPAVKASVARQLAMNERANPELNNTPVMRDFLNALGLWGNKAKGVPNILDAARAPAAAKFPTGRYEDALTRTQGQTPMRPRHAANMRAEMETYQPGPYTGPDQKRGDPMVARGDDTPYWLNPVDFFRDGKVNDAQVTAASVLSGPLSYAMEDRLIGPGTEFMIGSPDHIKTPQQKPAGMLAEVQPGAMPMPEEEPPFIPEPMPAPQQAAPQRPPVAQQAQAPRGDDAVIREIQQVMIDAGFAVGGRDGQPDGIVGPLTQRAIDEFTMGAQLDLEDVLRRIRNYPRDRLAQILAE